MAKRKTLQYEETLLVKHESTLWAHFANIFLGFWLLVGGSAFGFASKTMILSDQITGLIVILFSLLALSRKMVFAPWVVCFAGFWLEAAPLLFWAPDAASYLNDTLIGVLIVAFSLLIPGLPGVVEDTGHEIPPGWSYNPSAWVQRLPVIALGCVGWFISRYLAAYQLGYIDVIWDPVFGDGTEKVITSTVARFFPVSDAGLGALAYTIEALMGCKGGEARWRTMPWMVVCFAFLVVPVGIVSIVLVILQPVLVGYWCFLCLVAAFSMLIMVMLTLDEMMAVLYFLYKAIKSGEPFWATFFKGGDIEGTKHDHRTPTFHTNPWHIIKSLKFGVGFQWNLILTALIGVWILFTPQLFGIPKPLADSDHVVGALVFVLSILSLAEIGRPLRYLLIPLGLWIAIASWWIPGHTPSANWDHLITGVVLIALSLPRGKIRESYGSLSRWIK